MDNASPTSSTSLHPLLWIAGISVTLLSVVGIAALTGLLPSHSDAPATLAPPALTAAPAAVTPPPVAAPVAASQPVVAAPATAAAPASQRKTAARKSAMKTASAPAVPPSFGTGVPPDYVPPSTASAPVAPRCADCGVVASIRQLTHEGEGSGLGAVAGGVLGGVLGSNVGRGDGRTLATIAGAVGGGMLGNKIEKSQKQSVSYQITVHMEDGTDQLLDVATEPSWRIGDRVKLVNGRLVAP